MEVAVLQQLPERALDAHINKVGDGVAGCNHFGLVSQLDAFYPLHGQHSASSVLPVDLGDPDPRYLAVQLLQNPFSNDVICSES